MTFSSNLGFPRMGENRELKTLVENFWSKKINLRDLDQGAKDLRKSHWLLQQSKGIQIIPSNDFSLYDHVLDHIYLFGAIPQRYQCFSSVDKSEVDIQTYFAMARGYQSKENDSKKIDVGSMEMKKWFDTNYHYIVPEFYPEQSFRLNLNEEGICKPVQEYLEAKALNIETRPVVLGPISFLLLGKSGDYTKPYASKADALCHLDSLLEVYSQLFSAFEKVGVQWIQIDEPILCLDLGDQSSESYQLITSSYLKAFSILRNSSPSVKFLLATYFGDLKENYSSIVRYLPIDALHIDLVRGSLQEYYLILETLPSTCSLSLGLVDGRNVWKSNYQSALPLLELGVKKLGQHRILVSSSCSLLHSPHSINKEINKMDSEILDWLSFASEKLEEIVFLSRVANSSFSLSDSLKKLYELNQNSNQKRTESPRIHKDFVKQRLESINSEMFHRKNPFLIRREKQRKKFSSLPNYFPTTTIGSFPQTSEVRSARSSFKNKKITFEEYDKFIRSEIEKCIKIQEECDLDILVHGEFERTDMVEYFGEKLEGFVLTQNGWVQSYGSRCVKPPIIYGDVNRPFPMTLDYTTYAQSLTQKPMKGMLTGPVTILQWSFVRNDQPRNVSCLQIALAIRDEVQDLEKAGISCIQIDEPAIREGLPLRKSDWNEYLKWSVDSFLLSSSGVTDETQIHSHMCYSDFNDIFEAIQRMDTDVLTIENSKSDLKLLRSFELYGYANEIGPGLYDIHSPRVPTTEEMVDRVEKMLKYLPKHLIWVNPDCGLKTRGWKETKEALQNMVQVAKTLRQIV